MNKPFVVRSTRKCFHWYKRKIRMKMLKSFDANNIVQNTIVLIKRMILIKSVDKYIKK